MSRLNTTADRRGIPQILIIPQNTSWENTFNSDLQKKQEKCPGHPTVYHFVVNSWTPA